MTSMEELLVSEEAGAFAFGETTLEDALAGFIAAWPNPSEEHMNAFRHGWEEAEKVRG